MPRNPIDSDPGVIAARAAARNRASLAQQLDAFMAMLGRPADYLPAAADVIADGDRLAELAGKFAELAKHAEWARDVAVELARTLPADQRPSWQRLADALGEPDRNNLARRYRTRKDNAES